MKYLIKGFMGIGFAIMFIGLGCMDSASIVIPAFLLFLGLGMFAFGGYMDSYYEWYEERKNK